MTFNVFTPGSKIVSAEVNENFNSFKILSIDETIDLNVSTAGATDTKNKSYNISSSDLVGADYLIIKVIGLFIANASGTGPNTASSNLKIETTAPDAVTFLNSAVVYASTSASTYDNNYENSVEYIRILSANEKASGLTVKITTTASGSDGGAGGFSSSFTNRQIVFQLCG